MRLDKMLANSGLGTRSEVRALIAGGAVSVNGTIARKGDLQVTENDEVICNGNPVSSDEHLYFLLDKPDEVLTAMEDPRLPHVGEFIPDNLRGRKLSPVGRLDYHTTGLLIITNDGTLSHRLQSPKYKINKIYLVNYDGPEWTDAEIEAVSAGVTLTDMDQPVKLSPSEVRPHGKGTAYITLTEGKTHEVRRIFAKFNKEVTALRRELTKDEVLSLKRLTGL